MKTTANDYRDILRERLEARLKQNPRYSLRAFARDLKIAPAQLSDIMRGRYGMSAHLAAQVSKRLGLSADEQKLFQTLVEKNHSRSKASRVRAEIELEQIRQNSEAVSPLTLDAFQVISDWHHFAIMELTKVDGFQSSASWVARALDIPTVQAKLAIERLLRMEILEERDGTWSATKDFVFTPSGIPSDAIRKFHKQILSKAMESIESQTVDERDLSTIVMSIDSKDLPMYKEKIKKFRRELHAEALATPKRDSVYSLSIQLFKLSKSEK